MRLNRLALLPFALASSLLSAQEQISAPKATPGADLHLSVVVTGKHDQPVEQILTQSDFTLLDNGAAQPIQSFRHAGSDAPVRVLLVIDAVNIGPITIAYERQRLDKFLTANDGQLARPTALAILTDRGVQAQAAGTRDGKALAAALDAQTIGLRLIGRDTGIYGAEERLETSLNGLRALLAKEAELPGRKLMIFVSPGWPLLTGPRIDLSGKQQQGIFAQIVQLTHQLQQANVTLYSVDPRGTSQPISNRFYYQAYLKGVSQPRQTEFADLSLQVLTTHSGGLVLNSDNDLDELVKRAVDDAAQYYEIAFTPAHAEHADEYHSIDIKVAQPGLAARTRQGYYAEP